MEPETWEPGRLRREVEMPAAIVVPELRQPAVGRRDRALLHGRNPGLDGDRANMIRVRQLS